MIATAQPPVKKAPTKRKISWETFQKKYLTREDKFKYEWVNSRVEKTLRSMNTTQFYIFLNLENLLMEVRPNLTTDWRMMAEGDNFFAGNHRRPDIAFYTAEQMRDGRQQDEKIVPRFVVEVISANDQINKVDEKMDDYLSAKVEIVWHIFPKSQKVHVYHGKKMTICEDDDICSADSVIPGFEIAAKDVFK